MRLILSSKFPSDFESGHLSGVLAPVLSNSALTSADKLRLIGLVLLLWQRVKLTSTSKLTSSSSSSLVGLLRMYADPEEADDEEDKKDGDVEERRERRNEENGLIRALLDMAEMR